MNIPSFTTKLAYSSILVMAIGAVGVRFAGLPYQSGLLLFSLGGLLSLTSIIASALFTRRTPTDEGRRRLSRAAIIALPAIILFSLNLFRGASSPLIHDITTNIENPPQFMKAAELRKSDDNSLIYDENIGGLQSAAYPDIQTLSSSISVASAQQKALQIASNLNWVVYYQETGHIEALVRSFWFGFTDDLVIRIEASAQGSNIDLRSASRVGKGDLGANAHRIAQFLRAFQSETHN